MTLLSLKRLTPFILAGLVVLTLPACSGDDAEPRVDPMQEPTEPVASNDILAAASENGMTTLVTAVETAGLASTLRGEGPFTVFAPTNAAFAALPAGTLDTLMAPGHHEELARILQYHVLPGRIESNALAGSMSFTTVNGSDLTITAGENGVTVTDAEGHTVNVVTPDVNVSNGVVHVIDGVLMPGADVADAPAM